MKDLVKNPIGIIALFISLIYGFANLLLGVTATSLTSDERFPLIVFIVLFPVVVLGIFYLLVSRHHGKLYAPGDYKDDKSFLGTLSQEEREEKLAKEVEEVEAVEAVEAVLPQATVEAPPITEASKPEPVNSFRTNINIREELRFIETQVISKFELEFNHRADRDVAIGDTGANFDAVFHVSGKVTFLEIKSLRIPNYSSMMLDRLLYNAVIADKYMNSNFRLIIAVVYSFNKVELPRLERIWRKQIEKCPASIELRFISRDELSENPLI
jgi:hypothetical protein